MSLKSSEKIETNVVLLEIAIDADAFKAAILDVFRKKKSSIAIPGFRKGKAPLSLIERTYGKGVFYEDALEALYPQAVEDAYKDSGIHPVDSPYDVDIKEIGDDGVLFTIKVTVKPETTLTDYKGLTVEKGKVEVTDEEVDAEIASLRERNSRIMVVTDRPAADGDMTIIDFDGSVDGVPFEGGKAENHSLTLGSGSFIPGFEEQIVGHAAGDEFDVSVKFPEDYTPELAGADAVFKVKLHEIKVKELPELDDDFAKDVGEDYETVTDLKKGVRADLETKKQGEVDKAFEEAVLSALADNLQAEIPEVMFAKKAEENTRSFEQRLQQQGIDLQTYLMYFGSDREMFDAQMLEQAKKQVALQLALEKVAELEGITADEADFEAEYAKLAEMYGMEADKLKGFLTQETLAPEIVAEKAVRFVMDNAKAKAHAKKTKAAKKDEEPAAQEEKPAKKTAAKKKPAAKKDAE